MDINTIDKRGGRMMKKQLLVVGFLAAITFNSVFCVQLVTAEVHSTVTGKLIEADSTPTPSILENEDKDEGNSEEKATNSSSSIHQLPQTNEVNQQLFSIIGTVILGFLGLKMKRSNNNEK